MAYLQEIQTPGGVRDVKQVMDYLRQLEEQLRYVIRHIGPENIQAGAVGESQLSPQIKQEMQAVQRTVRDVNRNMSTYRQTAEEIAMEVRRMAENGVEKVKNAALTINADGIDMASGEINIRAGSAFRARSGGVFEVFAADENSFLKFGGTEENPNASLGNGGTLRVKTIYADSIHANATDLVASDGSLANKMIVSHQKPQGHGVLWVRPQAGSAADYACRPAAALPMNGTNARQTLTLQGADFLAGEQCRYGVKFSVYNHSGSCVWTGVKVYVQQAGSQEEPLLIYESQPGERIGVGDYFRVDTLSSPSPALNNLSGGGDLLLTVQIEKSAATSASFPARTAVTLRCTPPEDETGDGAQPCEIRFIP